MSGAMALHVAIFLPGRYGRLEPSRRYAEVLQSCTSCGSPLVLLREKFGDIEQNHVTRKGDHVMTGGWYCNKCGLHMVPVPGEDVKLAEKNLHDTPGNVARTPTSHETPSYTHPRDIKHIGSAVRSPINILAGSHDHSPTKGPTKGDAYGFDKENTQPIVDENFVSWERHLQLNFKEFLGNVREHYASKGTQLSQLKDNLKIREATLEINERSYQERLKKLSVAAQQARQDLHTGNSSGRQILSPFRECHTSEVAIQTDLHFDLKESIESGYSSGYTSSSQERRASPTRHIDNMHTDTFEMVTGGSNLILQTNPPLPPRKRKTSASHQDQPVLSAARSSEDIIRDVHSQSQAAGEIITLLEDWTKRKQQRLAPDDFHQGGPHDGDHRSSERTVSRAYREQTSRSGSREAGPPTLPSKPDHIMSEFRPTVRRRRADQTAENAPIDGLWADVSQNRTPSGQTRNVSTERTRTAEEITQISDVVLSPSPVKSSPTKPHRSIVTSPERHPPKSYSSTPAGITNSAYMIPTPRGHQSGSQQQDRDIPMTTEHPNIGDNPQQRFRTNRRDLSPPQPRMGSKPQRPPHDTLLPRTWIPDRSKLSTNPHMRAGGAGTGGQAKYEGSQFPGPQNNVHQRDSHSRELHTASGKYHDGSRTEAMDIHIGKRATVDVSGRYDSSGRTEAMEVQIGKRAMADRRSHSAGTIRQNLSEMSAMHRSNSTDFPDRPQSTDPLAQSTPTTTMHKGGHQVKSSHYSQHREYVSSSQSHTASHQLSDLAKAILSPTKHDSIRPLPEKHTPGASHLTRDVDRKLLSPLQEETPSYQTSWIQPRQPLWETRSRNAPGRLEAGMENSSRSKESNHNTPQQPKDNHGFSDVTRRQLFVQKQNVSATKSERPRSCELLDDTKVHNEPLRFSNQIEGRGVVNRPSVKHSVERFEQKTTHSAPQKRPISRFRRRSRSVELDWLG